MRNLNSLYIIFLVVLFACSKPVASEIIQDASVDEENINSEVNLENEYKILSLGDSYTIGESVCNTCRFPEQLKQRLLTQYTDVKKVEVDIVAKTGWRTNNLLSALEAQELATNYDFVTLLIGVNNQFQGAKFSLYEKEFPLLVEKAITYANQQKNRVVVLSIPDYTFTPYGSNFPATEEITQYNNFAKNYCESKGVTFLNITDITDKGLENPALVADDYLHPSALAYSNFVDRLLPLFVEKLGVKIDN